MAVWPVSLPQQPSAEGYSDQLGNQSIRADMDVGPPKVRRRSTAAVDMLSCQFDLTQAQCDTLDLFYRTTLSGGSLPFDWTHPRTLVLREFRLLVPPVYRYVGPDDWIAVCQMEVLP